MHGWSSLAADYSATPSLMLEAVRDDFLRTAYQNLKKVVPVLTIKRPRDEGYYRDTIRRNMLACYFVSYQTENDGKARTSAGSNISTGICQKITKRNQNMSYKERAKVAVP